jgi:hypothetical protein
MAAAGSVLALTPFIPVKLARTAFADAIRSPDVQGQGARRQVARPHRLRQAAGAGLSIALACDLRIAAAEAKLTTAFSKLGVSGDYGERHFPRVDLTARVG